MAIVNIATYLQQVEWTGSSKFLFGESVMAERISLRHFAGKYRGALSAFFGLRWVKAPSFERRCLTIRGRVVWASRPAKCVGSLSANGAKGMV